MGILGSLAKGFFAMAAAAGERGANQMSNAARSGMYNGKRINDAQRDFLANKAEEFRSKAEIARARYNEYKENDD